MLKAHTRILIADDDVDERNFVYYALLHYGYKVEAAVDGEEAVEKARAFKPDLVILDVLMPRKTGLEAANEIRGDLRFRGVPVIFLTGLKNDHDVAGDGPNAILAKPLEVTQLIGVMDRLLSSSTQG
ncbi:MAG TPA: response regulator [Candidatus Eisenbacteria bacterium]|jgi:two-component system alkaline phosphatase synthesis response regulator PhoP|nr:response regulator [Candidatus Eisenbacteria bacterium]